MPINPRLIATVKITVKDINGNNVAKQFNSVYNLIFDYNDATVNIVDASGSFYFPLSTITSFTYTITTGTAGSHVIVMS